MHQLSLNSIRVIVVTSLHRSEGERKQDQGHEQDHDEDRLLLKNAKKENLCGDEDDMSCASSDDTATSLAFQSTTSSSSLLSSGEEETKLTTASSHSTSAGYGCRSCLKVRRQSESIDQEYCVWIDLDLPTQASRKVAFDSVTIHQHMITLGDNPSTTCGPPLSLEWEAFHTCNLPLDAYETYKPKRSRSFQEMRIPPQVREDWLRTNAGFDRRQLNDAIRQVRRIQRHRMCSAAAFAVEAHADSSSASSSYPKAGGPYNPCGPLNELLRQATKKLLSWGSISGFRR